MNRRGFIGSVLALGAAPAIVRAESLMRIATPEIVLPEWTVATPTLQEIITTTVRSRAPMLAALIAQQNQIAKKMAKVVLESNGPRL